MSLDEIPEPIQRFVFEQIHSFEELEVVVLLNRDHTTRWTQEAIAEQLKITINLVGDAINALSNRGIVDALKQDAMTYYAPSTNYKAFSDQLVALYEQHRLEIVMLMSSNAIERVRTGAMRTFADSFFVGRKRDDG